MTESTRIRGVRAVAAMTLLSLAGCGTSSYATSSSAVSADDARADVVAYMVDRQANIDRLAPWYRSIDEVLPNVIYHTPGRPNATMSAVAVVGHITSVAPGIGGKQGAGDTWVSTTFDDPEVESRTIHLSVSVDETLGPSDSVQPGSTIKVGLAIPPEQQDLSRADFEAGLPALGRVVMFLIDDSQVLAYESLFAIQLDGQFVATVADDGELRLPFFRPSEASEILARTHTLDALRIASTEPRAIDLVMVGGQAVRPG